MKYITVLMWLSLLLIIFLFIVIKLSFTQVAAENSQRIAWCGTSSYSPENDKGNDGKLLFREYCASCHAKNMKSIATGPALGGVMSDWNNDTIALQKYLNDSKFYLSSTSNERLKSVQEIFSSYEFSNHKVDLTISQVKSIFIYIESTYRNSPVVLF